MKLHETGAFLVDGRLSAVGPRPKEEARRGTIAWRILQAHNGSADPEMLRIKFDSLATHDITYVGILQTARASGLERLPVPTTVS